MLERRRERREAAVSNGEAYLICVPMCLLEKERAGRHLGDGMLQIGVKDWGIGGEWPFCRVAGKMIGMEQKKTMGHERFDSRLLGVLECRSNPFLQ